MKTIISVSLIVSLLFSVASAQTYSKEEKAIINTLQQHYDHFKNRDYDKLAEMWVHEPYAGHIWVSPGNIIDDRGWEQISEATKNNFKNNPMQAPEVDFNQFTYTFHIRDNIAIVNFVGETNVRTTAILEKINGSWKYVQNNQIDQSSYELSAKLKHLGTYAGKWRMVPSSFAWENPETKGELLTYLFHIEKTSKGLDIKTKFRYRNPQQNIIAGTEHFMVNANSPNREWLVTKTSYYSNNGWSTNSSGKAEILDNSIELSGAVIGNENNSYDVSIQRDANDHLVFSSTDRAGEKWSVVMEQVE